MILKKTAFGIKTTCIIIAICACVSILLSVLFGGWWETLLLSVGVNLLSAIIIIVSVNAIVEKQSKEIAEEKEKESECRMIAGANKVISCILPFYITEFNQLTIPIDKRIVNSYLTVPSGSQFNESFAVNDLRDMFFNDLALYGNKTNCILETYDEYEKKLISAFERMLTICSFSHFPALENTIENILSMSYRSTTAELLSFLNQSGQSYVDRIKMMISDYSGNPDEDYQNNKYISNEFFDVLNLYHHLKRMKSAIEAYREEIQKVQ